MTNLPNLAQRFVDQELTGAERDAFAERIGRDGGLRRQVIALQRVAAAGSRAARPAVSAAFVAGVLERTATVARPSTRASRFSWLLTPHTLQWNLAQAAAVVVLAVGAGFGVARTIDSRTTTTAPVTGDAPTPVMVRLVVLQPDARTVSAVGDFNGWDPSRTSLQQVSSGVWSVTLPLAPGRYEYMFVVDGQRWVSDPAAVEQADDGFGSRNAVLEVPGASL